MKSKDRMSEDTAEIARERAAELPQNIDARSPEEIRQVFHELRVHQIELEMQNEELRRTQEELEAERSRYFDLYNMAPVGYITISEKGLIQKANLIAAGLLGVARIALVKQPITRFILKEDQDIYYLHRKHLFETGEPQACELRMVKKDGMEFWAQLEATVAQDEDDGTPLCRVTMSDITDHKRAEDELRKSEEKYRTLFNSAGDAIFIHDAEARILAVNPLACGWLGYTHEELMSMSIDQVDSPEEALHAQDRMTRLMEQRYLVFETVHQRKDGSLFPTEVSARRIIWDGQPAMMSTCRDITDRKRAEVALCESEEKYRLLAEQSLMGIHIIQEGRIKYVNQATATITGYSKEEMLNWQPNGFAVVIHPDDLPDVMQQAGRKQTGDPDIVTRYGWRLVSKSGEVKWIESFSKTISFEGSPADFVMMIDSTEYKMAEEKIKNQLDELIRWQDVMLDREDRIIDLKREVNELLGKDGKPPRYTSTESQDKKGR